MFIVDVWGHAAGGQCHSLEDGGAKHYLRTRARNKRLVAHMLQLNEMWSLSHNKPIILRSQGNQLRLTPTTLDGCWRMATGTSHLPLERCPTESLTESCLMIFQLRLR